MKAYIKLKLLTLTRYLKDYLGLPPLVNYILVFAFLFFGTISIIRVSPYWEIALSVIYLMLMKISIWERAKLEFLTYTLGKKTTYRILLIEAISLYLPFFIISLIYKNYLLFLLTLLSIIIFNTAKRIRCKSNRPINLVKLSRILPLEIIIGIRSKFYMLTLNLLFIAYSIQTKNTVLILLSIIFSMLLVLTMYDFQLPDHLFVKQIKSPKKFIFTKVLQAYTLFLSMTFIPAIFAVYLSSKDIFGLIYIITASHVFFCLFILGNFIHYPQKTSVQTAFLIAISSVFLPISLICIPHFYKLAIQNINKIKPPNF